jgi:uncharacterized protein YjdB
MSVRAHNWFVRGVASLAAALVAVGCNGGGDGVTVTVRPDTASLKTGATVQLYALVNGNGDQSVTWTVTEASGGAVSSGGLYTAPSGPGTFHVVATSIAVPSKTGTATITVTQDVSVSVSPTTATVAALAQKQFTATVTGPSDTSVTWAVQEAAGGTVSAAGLYTAPSSAGTFHVVATSVADTTKSAVATVTVIATQVTVTVSPSVANTTPSATQQFSASVSGNPSQVVTWSVQEGSAGGSVSATGLYTAPTTTGTYHVVATSQAEPSASGSAVVTVTTTPVVTVSVDPATWSMLTGATKQFTATVTGTNTKTVTWSVQEGVTGGTVNSGGGYTAPALPGTFHVVATSTVDTSKSASAEVTVAYPPVAITISPTSVTVAPGAIYKFTANVSNTANTAVSWSVQELDGGAVDSSGNFTAPLALTTNHVVATSQADTSQSATATVVVCASNALCTPAANPCHIGSTSCSASGQTCNDSSTNAPAGTDCGPGQVCNGTGVCGACVAGNTCTPADPCANGQTSCLTGASTCVPAGAKLGDGTSCGGTGTCQTGRCNCGAGSGYFQGTCASCPSFSGTTVYVDADPTKGRDDACCGRTQNAGSLGGPCLTIGQAYLNVPGNSASISVTPDTLKNVNAQEAYPIHLGRAVTVNLGNAFVRGASGQDVFRADVDGTIVHVNSGTLGVDGAGRSAGANTGFFVGAVSGQPAQGNLSSITIDGVVNGVRIDGGRLTYSYFTVNMATNAGLLCRSDSGFNSYLDGSSLTVKSAYYGVFAGQGCQMAGPNAITSYFGPSSGACPIPKPLQYGTWLEGNATYIGSSGTTRCVEVDALSLRANPLLSTNNPQAQLTGMTFEHSGCAGVYVASGKVTVKSTSLKYNHFGVWLNSAGASADIALAPVAANDPTYKNHLLCNSAAEPGQCHTGAYAATGFSVFNNSGYAVDVSNNYWGDSPVSRCNCDYQLQSCACVGSAYGQTTPPDAVSIVNAPNGAAPGGTPSVTMTSYYEETNPTCTY